MSDLDLLRHLGDQIIPPAFEELEATARARTRRTATLATIAAGALVAAVVSTAQLEVNRADHHPPPPAKTTKAIQVDPSRPLTYAEDATLHVGEQSVTMPSTVVEIDLTDDGVAARTSDGAIWFTDGSDLERIGTLGEPGARFDPEELGGYGFGTADGFVVSGNSGSLVAWWEFPEPNTPELVVYDTAARAVTTRRPIEIEAGTSALLGAVTERFAYLYVDPDPLNEEIPNARVDLDTGVLARLTGEEYTSDALPPGTPRTLFVGSDDIEGNGPFRLREGTMAGLLYIGMDGRSIGAVGSGDLVVLDGVTRKPFAFTAPSGFREPDPTPGFLTQWIDDDSIVIAFQGEKSSDLLVCHVSTGVCDLAAEAVEAVLPEIG